MPSWPTNIGVPGVGNSTWEATNFNRLLWEIIVAKVQLRLGDMFDGPSDMVVLPCSTAGTITSFVREKLAHFRIPFPEPKMELGDVRVMPFEGGENIAQYVAYAASVKSNSSSKVAIQKIGRQLGEFTNDDRASVRFVSAPLLGAGAGQLESELVVRSLGQAFKDFAHPDATLLISVLNEKAFTKIKDSLNERPQSSQRMEQSSVPSEERPPRVFISYTHSSPQHMKWVEGIGAFLRENGIDARLDVWHLRRGMDLPQFMTNELALADRVLIVSDEKYAEKADGRVGGVGWETMIVQGDMAQLRPENTKYLVLVRSRQVEEGLPRFLKTKFVIHWPDSTADAQCRPLLLRELFDHVVVPPLGKRPVLV